MIRGNRDLRLVTALMAAQTVVAGASLVYEVSIALDLLEMGESGLGLLDAVLGVGGILGGFVVLVLARRGRLASDFGVGVILWAAPLLLIAAVPSLATTLVAMFLIGLANSMVDVNAYTIVQRVAPAEVMGRVFGALESLLTVGMALGALVMPLLIELVGLRTGLVDRRRGRDPRRVGRFRRLAADRRDRPGAGRPGTRPRRCRCSLCCRHRCRNAWRTCSCRPPSRPARWSSGKATGATGSGSSSGGEAVVSIAGETVRQLGAGDSFGEIALLRDVPRTATVQAGDEDLVLQGLDRDEFLPAVTGHGEASEVADAVVERWLALG